MILPLLNFVLGVAIGFGINFLFQIKLEYLIVAFLVKLFIIRMIYEYLKSSGKLNMFKLNLLLYLPQILNKLKSNFEEKDSKLENNLLKLNYKHDNKNYCFLIPYQKKNELKRVRYEVYLVFGKREINITQPAGTIYKYSTFDYKADCIKVINKLTNETKIYKNKEIPFQ